MLNLLFTTAAIAIVSASAFQGEPAKPAPDEVAQTNDAAPVESPAEDDTPPAPGIPPVATAQTGEALPQAAIEDGDDAPTADVDETAVPTVDVTVDEYVEPAEAESNPGQVAGDDTISETPALEVEAGDETATAADAGPPAPDEEQPPVAENVVLSEPVPKADKPASEPVSTPSGSVPEPEPAASVIEAEPEPVANKPVVLLGTTVPVGTSARLSWSPEQSFEGIAAPTPVLVVNGEQPGPTVCLTAAVHGDELNGIEIVRRVLYDLTPEKLSGTVIGVPIVNLQGFRRSSRYLPDRRDLNRFFPGNPTGSSASRIAHSFFQEVIMQCDALVDLHTGSFHRTNLPQLRADLTNPQVARLTEKFGATVVLHSSGATGTLRRAASDAGIPAVTLEAGEPARVQDEAVSHGTRGIMTLLNELNMVRRVTFWGSREPVYYRSKWIRADQGGVLISDVELGQRVKAGQVLGTVTDPITNVQSKLVARSSGRVLGMALNQFVMPGFAAYRLGIEESDHPIVVTPSDGLDPDEDELAEEEEGSALVEDTEIKAVDARDYLEDSE